MINLGKIIFVDNYLWIIVTKIQFRSGNGGFFQSAITHTGRKITAIREDIFYSNFSLEAEIASPNQGAHSEMLDSTQGRKEQEKSGKAFTVGFSGRNNNFGGPSGFR